MVTERTVRKDELLLAQGQTSRTFKILKAGTAVLSCQGEDGVDRPIALIGAGQSLGTTALLQEESAVSCRALTQGRVCEVSIAAAQERGLTDADFFRELSHSYAKTNAQLAEWARIARVRGALGQLSATLLQLAQVQRSTLIHLPSHKVLADLLSTTRETVARTLGLLARSGMVVRRDRRHCEIQREALTSLVKGSLPATTTQDAA